MQKYCRKMKKRRVSFSLFHANDVGNMETLLSKLWAFVVQRCSFSCRPLACGNVSTGQRTCFHWPVETCIPPSERHLSEQGFLVVWLRVIVPIWGETRPHLGATRPRVGIANLGAIPQVGNTSISDTYVFACQGIEP